MKIAVALALLGLTTVLATAITTCGKPTYSPADSSNAAFDYNSTACQAATTATTAQCSASGSPTPYSFTYTIGSGDVGNTLYFQLIPAQDGSVKSTTVWTVTAGVPCGGIESCIELEGDFSASATTNSLGASSPIVTWVDAVTTTTYPGSSVATFTVSCAGNNLAPTFTWALWQGGSDLPWSQVGVNVAGPIQYLGVPCCGAVSAEWSLDGVATQHQALQATLTVVQGLWSSGTMHNADGFPDEESFSGGGLVGGIATARTCISNQSCDTVAKEYYISAITSSSNSAPEGSWVSLTLDLIAGAGTVSASVATLAAIAIACLF